MFRIDFWIYVFACTITGSLASPVVVPLPPTKPASNFAADEGPSTFVNPIFDIIHSGDPNEQRRWYNGCFVHPSPEFSVTEYNLINAALYDLNESFVSLSGYGLRILALLTLNLQYNGCIHKGTITHELIHSLGYYHEQTRPDRDSYVNIHTQNIIEDKIHNFNKRENSLVFGVSYDLSSIMHYGPTAFSKNGLDTITSKNGASVGSLGSMTNKDIQKLRNMYKC